MSIKIHLVYTGRGEALILEVDDSFYIIDGGPRGYNARATGGAPYFEYFISAIRTLWNASHPGQPFMPTAIYLSHAHEDHYRGIKKLFTKFLAKAFATTATTSEFPFVFNGPFITQSLKIENAREIDLAIGPLLTEFGFSLDTNFSPLEGGRTLAIIDGFYYSANAVRYNRTRMTRALRAIAQDYSVDSSPFNVNSLLMYHQPSNFLFTGDSKGGEILEFMRQIPTLPTALAFFKVPHHGSVRSSQYNSAPIVIPALAGQIYGLLILFSKMAA